MSDIKKIRLGGVNYDIKDAGARDLISQLDSDVDDVSSKIDDYSSCYPTQYVNPTKLTTLTAPAIGTSLRVQSMCYGDGYWFVLWINSDNQMIIQKYNTEFTTKITEVSLGITGHGNSMSYFNEKLYIANYTNYYKINVINASDLSVEKTFDFVVDVRGFAIKEIGNGRILVVGEKYSSGQIRFYEYMPNKKLQFLNAVHSAFSYTYRNGCKILTDSRLNSAGSVMFVSCIGGSNHKANASKGNSLEFTFPTTNKKVIVGILNSGHELQDVDKTSASSPYYLINNGGEVYTATINLFTTSANYQFMLAGVRDNISVVCYTGSSEKAFANESEYDTITSGSTSVNVCNTFYTPYRAGVLCGSFMNEGGLKPVCSVLNSTNTSGNLYVPLNLAHNYSSKLYEVTGYLCYYCDQYNATNLLGNGNVVNRFRLRSGSNTDQDVKIKVTNADGTYTFNRYRSYDELKTYLSTNGLGFVLGDTYPNYLYNPTFTTYGDDATGTIDWFED